MPPTATARRVTRSKTSTPASKRSSSSPAPCPVNTPISDTVGAQHGGGSGSAGSVILSTSNVIINGTPGVYTSPAVFQLTHNTAESLDPDLWYRDLEDDAPVDWTDTDKQRVRKALRIAARVRDAAANQWLVNTASATACCNTISFTNSATNWGDVNPVVWQYINTVNVKQSKLRKSIDPLRMNHHGVLIRSSDRGNMFSDVSQQEILALQLLRKMVSPEDFRKYLRHGFVPVRAASGLVYQIDRINRIKVWEMGEHLATLCVHLRGHCPPTDEVVGKILIVEYNEADIWKRSNITWHTDNRNREVLELVGQARIGTGTRIGKNFFTFSSDPEEKMVAPEIFTREALIESARPIITLAATG